MTGQTFRLTSPAVRERVSSIAQRAPNGVVVEFREPTRTSGQNAKLWALLTDIARAKPQGRVMSVDAWKALFMHAAGFQCTFEPSLDGKGVVPLGFKSSRLNKAEFSDLIEIIHAFAAEHGVPLSDDASAMSAREGHDPQGHGAKPASAVPQADAHPISGEPS